MLQEVKHSFGIPEYHKDVDLVVSDFSNQSLLINSDYEKVWQIFTNLISNAFKYTSSGTISFGIKQEQNGLICFVKDTGIGIPEKGIDHIFERFYRSSNVDKGKMGETGLGLSIVQELVQLIGSKIWVKSKEENGSTFYFTIANE